MRQIGNGWHAGHRLMYAISIGIEYGAVNALWGPVHAIDKLILSMEAGITDHVWSLDEIVALIS